MNVYNPMRVEFLGVVLGTRTMHHADDCIHTCTLAKYKLVDSYLASRDAAQSPGGGESDHCQVNESAAIANFSTA